MAINWRETFRDRHPTTLRRGQAIPTTNIFANLDALRLSPDAAVQGPNCRHRRPPGSLAVAGASAMSGPEMAKEGGHTAALFGEIWVADFEFRADPGEHPGRSAWSRRR